MFERFTADARVVAQAARTHAIRLGHRWTGTEHLLLALSTDGRSTAPILESFGITEDVVEQAIGDLLVSPFDRDRAALAGLGIDIDRVRERVEAAFGVGALDVTDPPRRRGRRRRRGCAPMPGVAPFSPRAKKCLELSLREALRLGHTSITPEHIGLGLLREGRGVACRVLADRGASFPSLVTQFEQRLCHLA
jgi:ATP-dependent Clp protease ATP-binding subunit ClpA